MAVVAAVAIAENRRNHTMRRWALACSFPLLALACAVRHGGDDNNPPPTQPLTVVVDTDQTMQHVDGGQGVGVFVEYAKGGHWHVRWACDTALSGLPCDFRIAMTGPGITNAKSTSFDSTDALDTASPDALVATTHVTMGVDAVDFDAQPGADVKIDLTMSGLRSGEFFFFIENGQVNGNFPANKLTDPLIFEPSTP